MGAMKLPTKAALKQKEALKKKSADQKAAHDAKFEKPASPAKRTPRAKVTTPDAQPSKGKKAVSKIMTKFERIMAWSYSRYSVHRQCPFMAKLKFIDKLKEPDHPAQARGTKIHLHGELFLRRQLLPNTDALIEFNQEFARFRKDMEGLRKRGAAPERQIAFDKNWNQVDWFSKEAWCRIKVDAIDKDSKKGRILVVDYKTGKRYLPDHEEQLELYAIAMFLLEDDVNEVRAEDWYLDSGQREGVDFERGQLAELQKKWEKRVAPMMTDQLYPKKPDGYKCGRCHFRKANGGPCTF